MNDDQQESYFEDNIFKDISNTSKSQIDLNSTSEKTNDTASSRKTNPFLMERKKINDKWTYNLKDEPKSMLNKLNIGWFL